MILRRVMEHVKSQNWTAVAVDFLIVVVGVFIGIQLGNWNDARLDQRAYRDAMTRLAEETTENLHSAASLRTHISEMLSDVQPAIDVLRTCETGSNTEETVNNGLNTIRSARSAGAVTVAIDQLVENERRLNGQSDEVSALLRQFYSELHDINATANFVQRAASAGRDEHPLIGFTGMIDRKTTFNGVDSNFPLLASFRYPSRSSSIRAGTASDQLRRAQRSRPACVPFPESHRMDRTRHVR